MPAISQYRLTAEQQEIIDFPHDMKINACAGSGKTTTLVAYAESRSPTARILYIAFNRSVRLEASTRFQASGLRNVAVHTAHSLAYEWVIKRGRYKLASRDLTVSDLIDLFSLKRTYGQRQGPVMAAHVKRCFNYFCNCDKLTICGLDYLATIDRTDKKARRFVSKYELAIVDLAGRLFNHMETGILDVSHDFYLKSFS